MLVQPNGVAVRATPGKEPLFSFGVIADVQYADIPDGRSFLGVPRYYRHSITVLQRAVRAWNAADKQHVRFCVNFGDIVDGFCPKDRSLPAVQAVVAEFARFHGPAYHMLGNHCLYNLPRTKLVSLLRMPTAAAAAEARAYYDFSPFPGYRFVVLDAYDFSAGGYGVDGRGVHHRTLEAALECPPGTDAFGRVDVYLDRMALVGTGRMRSTDMPLPSD
uniref:Calcineurin-like phosphoesterase domain-containing protein n=1 Tax=Oryza brachyantha TaxID=4533 RepID=J3MV87_ORYBR